MPTTPPTIHFLCGKIASGKSTLAAQLADAPQTVLISEDEWLSALFGDQMTTGADFVRFSSKLRAAVAPHIRAVLRAGVSVVLDFAGNTVAQRRWMQGLVQEAQVAHVMHVLAPPDDICLERLRERNASGAHEFVVTEAQFLQFSKHFVEPTPEEGFNIWHHGR